MEKEKHLETLTEIRSLMEKSTRFMSLSGLTGISAGIFGLIGAWMVHVYLDTGIFDRYNYIYKQGHTKWGMNPVEFFVLDAGLVLFLAVSFGIFFSYRKANKKGQKLFDRTALRMLVNLFIPLTVGGLFCLIIMFKYGLYGLVAPCTLIFYGLALLHASKYTLHDIRYLGITEIVLGLVATYYVGYGILFWAIGFGVMHIVYGILLYLKYDR